MTCHVAQGLTVDRACVLADEWLTSEVGYTALSRGRLSNHIYLAERMDDPSSEFAPAPASDRTAVERLVTALSNSRATVLAIDAGRPHVFDQLSDARHELARAQRLRADLEGRRWRPGHRDRLASVRSQEAAAHSRVVKLELAAAEERHRELPFVEERSHVEQVARLHDRIVERQLVRGMSRGIER